MGELRTRPPGLVGLEVIHINPHSEIQTAWGFERVAELI